MHLPLKSLVFTRMNKYSFDSQHVVEKNNSMSSLESMTKQVSFSNIAHVILIPSREEYSKLRDMLWYNQSDYIRFVNNVYC